MKIKVCGITKWEQMQQLAALGVDYAGMIFYPPSKRFAGAAFDGYEKELAQLPIKKVGVFVNAERNEIIDNVHRFSLSAVQLHGDETPELAHSLMAEVDVIRAIRVGEGNDLEAELARFVSACHYLLFDTDAKTYGGSGKKFNWARLQSLTMEQPFFLSGGIGLEDAEEVALMPQPLLHAVDINSRFEREPGIKDMDKVTAFVQKLKTS